MGRALAKDIADPKTGELLLECNTEISEENLAVILEAGISDIETLYTNDLDCGPFISDTLRADPSRTQMEALVEIYRMMRPENRLLKSQLKTCFSICFST
jgi:DNA-directed RNA polymerase subunit beta